MFRIPENKVKTKSRREGIGQKASEKQNNFNQYNNLVFN